MDKFIYKKSADVTALSASFTDFKYKKHCHEEYALGVTLRGIQEYNLDGGFQSSHQDGVMLFNPEQVHDGMSHDESGIDYVMVYIKTDIFLKILEKKDMLYFPHPIVYNYKLEKRILNLTHAIFSGKEESLCTELLLELVENVSQIEVSTVHRNNSTPIKKAKEMMFYNLENVLKLDDICKELEMSKFQFIRAFRSNTGITPYQYFLNCKVEHAKKLIERHTDIYLAVEECGFVDLTHLNRHFKSIYGITAFEYMSHIGKMNC